MVAMRTDTTGNAVAEPDDERYSGYDIVRPNNTVVVVGDPVEMPCKANVVNESRWDYYNYRARAMQSVYNGDKVHVYRYAMQYSMKERQKSFVIF